MTLFKTDYVKHALISCCLFIPGLSLAAEKAIIDILVVYTQSTADTYDGDPSTRFNHLIRTSNQIYQDSGVNIELRVAHAVKIDYSETNSAEIALRDMTFKRHRAFDDIAHLRQSHHADMVVLFRPFVQSHQTCGLAWIAGAGSNGDFSDPAIKDYQYSHIAVNGCGDYVTAHELGHNLGLRHSHRQDGAGGTTPYALGHGVTGSFTTIMAYQSAFDVDYWSGKIYKFSNPALRCKGQPCGIDRNQKDGADASYVLNITGPQVAKLMDDRGTKLTLELQAIYDQIQTANATYQLAQDDYLDSVAQLAENRRTLHSAQEALRISKHSAQLSADTTANAVQQYSKYAGLAATAQGNAKQNHVLHHKAKRQSDREEAQRKYRRFTKEYERYTALANYFFDVANRLQPTLQQELNKLTLASSHFDAASRRLTAELALNDRLQQESNAAKHALITLQKQYKKLAGNA